MVWKHLILVALILTAALAFEKGKSKKGKGGSGSGSDSEQCDSDSRELKTKYVCEDDEMHIKCPKGQLVHILWVLYGRDCEDKCVKKHDRGTVLNTNCSSPDAREVADEKCNDKNHCTLCADSREMGDACPGTPKYLEVIYDCVKPKKCKSKFEKFTVCASNCPATCNGPAGNASDCGSQPGCECIDGFVLDEQSGWCVCDDMCPWKDEDNPKCKTREHFVKCATLCPKTCEDRFPQKPCPAGCKPGYECDNGFIRDTSTGRCIWECDCPCCTQPPPPVSSSSSSSSSGSDETRSFSESKSEESCSDEDDNKAEDGNTDYDDANSTTTASTSTSSTTQSTIVTTDTVIP